MARTRDYEIAPAGAGKIFVANERYNGTGKELPTRRGKVGDKIKLDDRTAAKYHSLRMINRPGEPWPEPIAEVGDDNDDEDEDDEDEIAETAPQTAPQSSAPARKVQTNRGRPRSN